MNSRKLAAAIEARSEEAIHEAIHRYSRLLWSVAGAVLRPVGSAQDVEECVADAFIYLWENSHKFDPERGTLKSWLVVIARTKALDRCRDIAKRSALSLEEAPVLAALGAAEEVIREETRQALLAAVRALGEPEREILLRRYCYEQKPKEIALALDMSVKQVNNRLYQTKLKLRKALSGETGGHYGCF